MKVKIIKNVMSSISIFVLMLGNVNAKGWKSNEARLKVLRNNKVGRTYKFRIEYKGITSLSYLGKVHDNHGEVYKIVTSIWIWGYSHRATNCILIYNDQNKFIGAYNVTTITDLPNYIKKNDLVFANRKNDCDTQLISYINFNKGIPKTLFRKCKDDLGDLYTFEQKN